MAMTDIKLISLRCPDCGQGIESGDDDVVHFCANCGKAFEVIQDKFKKVGVIFAKPKEEYAEVKLYYLPMWQILSRISIKKKHSIDVSQLPREILANRRFASVYAELLNKEKPIEKMIFFVPAFGVTNRYQLMDQPGLKFTVNPPELKSDSVKNMVGAEYSLLDAIELAKDMFLSIQYKTDTGLTGLRDSDIKFDYKKARIAGIPFYEEKGMLIDALQGHRIFKNGLKAWDRIKEKLDG
jgi:predicted RNA-binding Zn-ribbon protein involved in translation (DUF1610 family)